MAYVDPDYAVPAATASSDAYNILVDDVKDHESRILGQAFSGAHLRRATSQSISNATWTDISFSSTTVDVDDWWSAGTNIVVPSAAVPTGFTTIAVRVLMQFRFATNGTGLREIRVEVNGTPSTETTIVAAISGDTTTIVAFDTVVCAAADVITIAVYQSSGGSLNLFGGAAEVQRLGGVA